MMGQHGHPCASYRDVRSPAPGRAGQLDPSRLPQRFSGTPQKRRAAAQPEMSMPRLACIAGTDWLHPAQSHLNQPYRNPLTHPRIREVFILHGRMMSKSLAAVPKCKPSEGVCMYSYVLNLKGPRWFRFAHVLLMILNCILEYCQDLSAEVTHTATIRCASETMKHMPPALPHLITAEIYSNASILMLQEHKLHLTVMGQ